MTTETIGKKLERLALGKTKWPRKCPICKQKTVYENECAGGRHMNRTYAACVNKDAKIHQPRMSENGYPIPSKLFIGFMDDEDTRHVLGMQ